MGSATLECPHCGDVAVESSTGLFYEGDADRCQSCGVSGAVFLDDDEDGTIAYFDIDDAWPCAGEKRTGHCPHCADDAATRNVAPEQNQAVTGIETGPGKSIGSAGKSVSTPGKSEAQEGMGESRGEIAPNSPLPLPDRCPKCGGSVAIGYGLACGPGIGSYAYCQGHGTDSGAWDDSCDWCVKGEVER